MSSLLNQEEWIPTTSEQSQQIMRGEYAGRLNGLTFNQKLKQAAEAGILLFVKYSLILILSVLALTYLTNIVSGSQNGTNAILYLNELQSKGYLPKVVNGSVPPKSVGEQK